MIINALKKNLTRWAPLGYSLQIPGLRFPSSPGRDASRLWITLFVGKCEHWHKSQRKEKNISLGLVSSLGLHILANTLCLPSRFLCFNFRQPEKPGVTRVTAISHIRRKFSVCCSRLSHICNIYLIVTIKRNFSETWSQIMQWLCQHLLLKWWKKKQICFD